MVASTTNTHRDLFTSPEARAERILLDLADYLYANTALKPMSKTLFAISRLMLVIQHRAEVVVSCKPHSLTEAYESALSQLGSPLADDFDFGEIAMLCQRALPRILQDLNDVVDLVGDSDALGLLFNTLVRGKWDSGEGMGTFLTPEEVVEAMVEMVLTRNEAITSGAPVLAGDICGGTGRFPFAFVRSLRSRFVAHDTNWQVVSFDQSLMATDYARLNLHFMTLPATCEVVSDSLIDAKVTALKGQCSALATNPPFGAGKYEISGALTKEIPKSVLGILGGCGRNQTMDPAALFVFRNLDLLRLGGVLGIVLPDGVLRSNAFLHALKAYERERQTAIEVRAIVSLPTVTFAFGGTVAKTSILIASREGTPSEYPVFVSRVEHIGFRKRGNKRVVDRSGNDLISVVRAYGDGPDTGPLWAPNWRHWGRLGSSSPTTVRDATAGPPLTQYCSVIREFTDVSPHNDEHYHISVLDVDETGLIDVLASSHNRPVSRVFECQSGDVLLSCINPRIWRVTVVPSLPGRWTCSPEFLVLRPLGVVSSWELAMRLHHADFKAIFQAMAGGTSSSRQRVDRDAVLVLPVPQARIPGPEVDAHASARERFYASRVAEGRLYEALHNGRRPWAGEGGTS